MSEFEGLGPDAAHAWRHNNLGRLLHFAFAAFESQLLAGYHAAGFTDVRHVHLNALRHVDYRGGTRIVVMAERAGVTKGAMGQLVEDCRRLGLVELETDTSDKRAKIVRFTARGRRLMTVTRRVAERIETEFMRVVGTENYERLRGDLLALRTAIATGAETDGR